MPAASLGRHRDTELMESSRMKATSLSKLGAVLHIRQQNRGREDFFQLGDTRLTQKIGIPLTLYRFLNHEDEMTVFLALQHQQNCSV